MNQNFDALPEPIGQITKKARTYLASRQRNFASLLVETARERGEFIKKNQLYPREKYAAVEEQWQALLENQMTKLSDYMFNLRLLQEGKTVQEFLSIADPIEKARFTKYLECEKRPMF